MRAGMPSTFGVAKVPSPCRRATRPSCCRMVSAWRTVPRLTRNWAAMTSSLGSWPPPAYSRRSQPRRWLDTWITTGTPGRLRMGAPKPSAMVIAPAPRLRRLHVSDDGVAKLAALHFRGALHQPRKVIGDRAGPDGAFHALDDQVGGLAPAHVAQHHLAREDDRAGVNLVLVGILGRGAVGGLEDGVAAQVVD